MEQAREKSAELRVEANLKVISICLTNCSCSLAQLTENCRSLKSSPNERKKFSIALHATAKINRKCKLPSADAEEIDCSASRCCRDQRLKTWAHKSLVFIAPKSRLDDLIELNINRRFLAKPKAYKELGKIPVQLDENLKNKSSRFESISELTEAQFNLCLGFPLRLQSNTKRSAFWTLVCV